MTTPLPSVETQLKEDPTWKNAIAAYQANPKLSKEHVALMASTSPQDLKHFLISKEQTLKQSKYSKSVVVLGTCTQYLVRHEKAIDMFAQAGGMPGCVLWGSIRLALEVAQGFANEYDRLLKALTAIVGWLESVKIEAHTFTDSAAVITSLTALYTHAIEFWEKAILLYSAQKTSRLLNALKSVWVDYGKDFEALRLAMESDLFNFRAATSAQHHRDFKIFQEKQDQIAATAAKQEQKQLHLDILRWLCEDDNTIHFHQSALAEALKWRHPGTCEWIFEEPAYLAWAASSPQTRESLLWIHAIAGAGKTVLAGSLILRRLALRQRNVLYFFFRNTDHTRNSSRSAAKSILYQMYSQALYKCRTMDVDLIEALRVPAENRLSLASDLWGLIFSLLELLEDPKPEIILDGLDECSDRSDFPYMTGNVRMIITSRDVFFGEQVQTKAKANSFKIVSTHTGTDIKAYISDSTACGTLAHPAVRPSIVACLNGMSDGMFLWVHLMIQDLKAKFSIAEIGEALRCLPDGLDSIYDRIWSDLNETLKASEKNFRQKVILWLVCAQRPLKTEELFAALTMEYSSERFMYSPENIIAVIRRTCGSLVNVEHGTVQFIHSSVKEFILGKSTLNTEDRENKIPLKFEDCNLTVLHTCLTYLQCAFSLENNIEESSELRNTLSWLSLTSKSRPLLRYCCIYWIDHLIGCSFPDIIESEVLNNFLTILNTRRWIEMYLLIEYEHDGLRSLRRRIYDLYDTLTHEFGGNLDSLQVDEGPRRPHCLSWCVSVGIILNSFGDALEQKPGTVHTLNFPSHEIDHYDQSNSICSHRSMPQSFSDRQAVKISPTRRLSAKLEPGSVALGLFYVSRRYNAYIFADKFVETRYAEICIQDCTTGWNLQPVVNNQAAANKIQDEPIELVGWDVSSDERHLTVLYRKEYNVFITCLWCIQERLNFSPKANGNQWATLIYQEQVHNPLFTHSARPVLMVDNSSLLCPSGQVDLKAHVCQPFKNQFLSLRDSDVPKPQSLAFSHGGFGDSEPGVIILFFSKDGYVNELHRPRTGMHSSLRDQEKGFTRSHSCLTRYSIAGHFEDNLELRPHHFCQLMLVSDSGRFILWSDTEKGKFRKIVGLTVHDRSTGCQQRLQYKGKQGAQNAISRFLDNERKLLIATAFYQRTTLCIWEIASIPPAQQPHLRSCKTVGAPPSTQTSTTREQSKPKTLSSLELPLHTRNELRGTLQQMHIDETCGILSVVTTQRIITRFRLQNLENVDPSPEYDASESAAVQIYVSKSGLEVACIMCSDYSFHFRSWKLNEISTSQEYHYSYLGRGKKICVSPSLEYIFLNNGYKHFFRLPGHGIDDEQHGLQEMLIGSSIFERWLSEDFSLGENAEVAFSSCGSYFALCKDSIEGLLDQKEYDLRREGSISIWRRPETLANEVQWTSLKASGLNDSTYSCTKFSLCFHPWTPVCVFVLWSPLFMEAGFLRCAAQVHSLDLESLQAVKVGEAMVVDMGMSISDHPPSLPEIKESDTSTIPQNSNISSHIAQAWSHTASQMARSTEMSRCGSYIVIRADTNTASGRWQRVLDLEQLDAPTGLIHSNPQVIGPEWTYWHEHRFRTTIQNQVVLLNRSARDSADRDKFSLISCHETLIIVPAYLCNAKASLIIPNDDDAGMKVLLIAHDRLPETVDIALTWNELVTKLDEIAFRYCVE